MFDFIFDFALFGIFVIGLTAFLGIITHGISAKLFGKSTYLKFESKSKQIQDGWKKI